MKRLISVPLLAVLVSCAPNQTAPNPVGSATPTPVPSAAEPTATPSPTGFSVSGIVYDEGLSPLVARITAQADGGTPVTVETSTDGRFTLRLPAGNYRITASKDGWTTREQAVTVDRDVQVAFGGLDAETANPYFLSNWPEIETVEVSEAPPKGPLVITLRLSEPITAESRERFVSRLDVLSGTSTEFLRASGAAETYLRATTAWDGAGRTLTLTYPAPYLLSGMGAPVRYTVRLRQEQLTEKVPGTDDFKWDPLNIVDVEGRVLGNNRADFAFVKPALGPIPLTQLSNKLWGTDHSDRRWNLTHTSSHSFIAAVDSQGPGLESATIKVDRLLGTQNYDVLELRFDEPMRVAKNAVETQYSRLDKLKQLAVLSVSAFADGSLATPVDNAAKIQEIRFSLEDPNVVTFLYIAGTFKDKKWFDVTLGPDALDPVGNSPNPAKIRAAGTVY